MKHKRNVRAFLAAAFLFVLIAEWGSHSLMCSGHENGASGDGPAMFATQGGHDDPCRSLILCRDNQQRDQQLPKLGHDATQHNALFDPFSELDRPIDLRARSPIPFSGADGLARPPDPAFHPPEIS